MSDDDVSILAEELVDFCDTLESAVVKLRLQIEELLGFEVKRVWNPSRIKWFEAKGAKGKYQRSEDVNNLDFKALVKELASHNGKLMRDSHFYWLFKSGSTVGRKKRG